MASYLPDPKGASASEDVNDFLQRIKQLGESRVTEDLERSKKLEEDIAQSKRQRQARRAERTRSISPAKSSPANTPPTFKSAARRSPESSPRTIAPSSATHFLSSLESSKAAEAPATTSSGLQPSPDFLASKNPVDEAVDSLNGSNYGSGDCTMDEGPMKENAPPLNRSTNANDTFDTLQKQSTPIRASPSSALPSRSSPLSWQRRPTSQASDQPKSRPLSQLATENAARSPRATPDRGTTPVNDINLSRNQIAQSLASKDPTWFRQTADRGTSSAAYRRNQVEDDNVSSMSSSLGRAQLPGMPGRSDNAGRTSPPSSGMGSPIPLTSSQRLDPPSETTTFTPEEGQASFAKSMAMSPSQGRISPERMDRPISPTKGTGGFVQSAMMKRTDSVNKRWSVQSPQNLSRSNSIAPSSNRNSMYDVNTTLMNPSARPTSRGAESPSRSPSRPTSNHSNAPAAQDFDHLNRSPTPAREQESSSLSRPSSPSRVSDSRRWSPTKSSWLESALNKPESPKPKPTPPPAQPSWMVGLQKAKQNGCSDAAKPSGSGHKHQVSIGGLMRSPPMGGPTKPLSMSGLPAGFSPGAVSKGRDDNDGSQDVNAKALAPSRTESNTSVPTTVKSSLEPETEVEPEKIPSKGLGDENQSLSSKSKPETPPKKDFGTFKAHQQIPDSRKEEPEFKNVFGKLKQTKTRNYVAPDELKDNILRGKAGLAITGGPKKTERKDEFKEAILARKEDFKAAQSEGKGVTRVVKSDSQNQPVPEAIARRRTLSRANGALPSAESLKQKETPPATPEALLKQRTMRETSKPSLPKETSAPGRIQVKEPTGEKLADRFNPGLAGLLARGPPSMASETSRATSPSSTNRTVSLGTSATDPEVPETGPQLTHMTKARARGPRRKVPTSGVKPAAESPKIAAIATPATSQPSKFVPTLEKLVQKESIKEPKPEPKEEPAQKGFKEVPKPRKIFPPSKPEIVAKAPAAEPIPQPTSRKLDIKSRSLFLAHAQEKATPEPESITSPKSPSKKHMDFAELLARRQTGATEVKIPVATQKPVVHIKSPLLTQAAGDATANLKSFKSPESSSRTSPVVPPKPQASITSINDTNSIKSPEVASFKASPVIPAKPQLSPKVERTPPTVAPKVQAPTAEKQPPAVAPTPISTGSVKGAAAIWSRSSVTESMPPPPLRVKSPIKLPTQADEQAAMESAGLRSKSDEKKESPGIGLGIGLISTNNQSTVLEAKPLLNPGRSGPPSPTHSLRSSPSIQQLSNDRYLRKPMDSPSLQTTETTELIANFFGQQFGAPSTFDVDTASILSSNPIHRPKVRTLSAQTYQLGPDGRKQAVPSHLERILFEREMYLCVHTFEVSGVKKTPEIYLWSGAGVDESIAKGVESFAQREARNVRGKLITISQGKETSEFLQALGGAVITRRGSSNKHDSLAPHILCGRRHMGEIVFDEVDFAPTSLCSGFPYLIATKSAKTYLWVGKGSNIDEISCAKLIGMEFGLTGEIVEIQDGKEPEAFLQDFGDAKIPKSAEHWRLKASYDKYRGRLFRAEASKIHEIVPFTQADISPSSVYVLDAFFEMYIIVGAHSQSEFAAFSMALHFAQEYGMEAALKEDRPFVPISTVVLEGVPKDLKSVFRQWKDTHMTTLLRSPSVASTSDSLSPDGRMGLKRTRSLRVVPLMAALEATRNSGA